MAAPAFITFSAIVPSPSTAVVKAYFFLTKFATTVLSELITIVVSSVPSAPVHLSKTYSAAGVAIRVAVSPSLYCLVEGITTPVSTGLTDVVNIYMIGSGEQDTTNKTDNSRRIFFIASKIKKNIQIEMLII